MAAAFLVLEQVREREPARLVDVVGATGIPRATVHRLLSQLVAVGAVRREGARYWVGAGLVGLGAGGVIERRLRTAAGRPIAELAARTGAGVSLTVGVSDVPVFLDFIDAHRPLGLQAELGGPVRKGTAQSMAHTRGMPVAYVDAGRVIDGITCVAVGIPLPYGGTAAVTALMHGSKPSPALLNATRTTAARITDLLNLAE